MKLKEVIKELEKLDQECEVCVYDMGDDSYSTLENIYESNQIFINDNGDNEKGKIIVLTY